MNRNKSNICKSYKCEKHIVGWHTPVDPITETHHVCYGTRERDECSCRGNVTKCDFYPEKRAEAIKAEKALMEINVFKEAYQQGRFDAMADITHEHKHIDVVGAVKCKNCKWRYYTRHCPMAMPVDCNSIREWTENEGWCHRGEPK